MEDSVQQNGYITKHSQAVRAVAFHPEDKDLVVSAGEDGKIKLVSRATGTVRWMWTPNHGKALSVCFSSDGNSIAAGFSDGTLMILDPQGGKEVRTLTGHTDNVNSVAFSPDGRLVASGSDDNTVRIWDVEKGKEAMAPLRGHTGSVHSVVFSPDGKLAASGSGDNTVMIWDVETGKEAMAPLRGDKSSWVGVPAEISNLAQRVQDGTRDKNRSEAFVVTANGDHVFVYSLLDDHHKLDGDKTKEAVAQYRAPANISSISCMGTCVCVGLVDGQVCVLYFHVSKHFMCHEVRVCHWHAEEKNQKIVKRVVTNKSWLFYNPWHTKE